MAESDDEYDWRDFEEELVQKDAECARLRQKYETMKEHYENQPDLHGSWLVLVGDFERVFLDISEAVCWGLQQSRAHKTPCPFLVHIGIRETEIELL
jgi:hypothetical protein